MAKNNVGNTPPQQPAKIGEFINSAGVTYRIRGISPMLPERLQKAVEKDWIEKNGQLPTPPTYEITLPGGDTETATHTEESIKDPKTTDQEKQAWDTYQDVQNQISSEYNNRLANACFLCVMVNPDDDPEWAQEQEFLGMDIPENPTEKKIVYVETRVLSSVGDIAGLMARVLSLSGVVDEEGVTLVENKFRRELEGIALTDLNGTDTQ